MKIAVATDDNISICGHVGKCKGFLIIDVENGQIINKEVRENSFTNHSRRKHGDGDHQQGDTSTHRSNDGHKRLAEGLKDCEYLVSHGMGRKLVEDIKSIGIKPIVTAEDNAETAAIKLEQGKLKSNEDLVCS